MERALFLFMMFSIIGWVWETPYVSIKEKRYINRGFLHGPYIPIYGFAVMTVVFTMQLLQGLDHSNLGIAILEIIYIGLITAIWEFTTSYVMEKVFHARWWDYSHHRFNIQGRVSLYVTTFFALGGYILWRLILPTFDNLYSMIPTNYLFSILSVFYFVFIVDEYFTLRDLFKVRDIIITLERVSIELSMKLNLRVEEVKSEIILHKENMIESLLELKEEIEEKFKDIKEEKFITRIRTQLDTVKQSIENRPRLRRLSDKYPNSHSKTIQTFKHAFYALQKKIKRS